MDDLEAVLHTNSSSVRRAACPLRPVSWFCPQQQSSGWGVGDLLPITGTADERCVPWERQRALMLRLELPWQQLLPHGHSPDPPCQTAAEAD